ncbi:MAG: glyceraldehyde-3-phosphate dehydrogenase [Desulfamplus sp.]|nr:glyceraldehyde-3-phosphate dehydrogenase [Desulfamplus sp.]
MEYEGSTNKLGERSSNKIGINGFGRIGKLTAWHHINRRYFDEIVINIGRNVGSGMDDIAHYMERDSTYGGLSTYLHGCNATPVISEISESEGSMTVDGVKVKFLREARNPAQIKWKENKVSLVVDTTGQFLDPAQFEDDSKGSIRGHLKAGVEKVIVSAPFKLKDKGLDLKSAMPEDAITTVMGINDHMYDPRKHSIISNASCTTNCLAHMMKPVLDVLGSKKILSASMATIHAATGSQQVLDRLPGAGKTDLRKNRSILNNIILTSTGAAKALALVIPEMQKIGFIAESVRIPTSTGSLVILVLNLQEDIQGQPIRRNLINDIYRQAAQNDPRGYLHYTDKQNVSCDLIGNPRAAVTIEGHETHTRTAEVNIDLSEIPGLDQTIISTLKSTMIHVPVTQTVIYGWYDNEMGSYVNMLGDRTVSIAEEM